MTDAMWLANDIGVYVWAAQCIAGFFVGAWHFDRWARRKIDERFGVGHD